jgi:hypothetical protein
MVSPLCSPTRPNSPPESRRARYHGGGSTSSGHCRPARDGQLKTAGEPGITNTSRQRYPAVEALLDDERLDFVQINYSLAERESA